MSLTNLIKALPKAELHLHIEGSLEPQMMWDLAKKHNITLPYACVDDIAAAYNFKDLQSFLDLYYQGAQVLQDEHDFEALMWAYLLRCKQDNIVHTEVMFDPQTHTERGIEFAVFMSGFKRAIKRAKNELGISVYLIMCFLRHLSEQDAFDTLHLAEAYFDDIKAIGLDSSELGNPPEKFKNVFAKAKAFGFSLVAHAGEEGPADYIWQAINSLKVDRVDHGVRCVEDEKLLDYLIEHRIALTVCPFSNVKLKVVEALKNHNVLELLERGLTVTVNADDPSYFGGYLNDNFVALHETLGMNKEQLIQLVNNSFRGSFLPRVEQEKYLAEVSRVAQLLN